MAEKHGLMWLAGKVKEGKAQNPLTEQEVAIIRGMANNNLRMTDTAKGLFVHRNTVLYHCDKIKQKTGADPRDFFGCWNLLLFIRELERGSNGKT